MIGLARELYGEEDSKNVARITDGEGDLNVLLKTMGKSVLNSEKILLSPSLEQLTCIFSVPDFEKTDEEVLFVVGAVKRYLRVNDILPRANEHSGYDLAARTLLSFGLFYSGLVSRWKNRGTPRPEFYRGKAINALNYLGRKDVANNFDRWTGFMQDRIVVN